MPDKINVFCLNSMEAGKDYIETNADTETIEALIEEDIDCDVVLTLKEKGYIANYLNIETINY